MEHAREATWSKQKTRGTNSTVVHPDPVARQNEKQQIYPLGLPVLEKMVSLQTLFRAYSFGTFCFQQTTAEFWNLTNRLRRRSFPIKCHSQKNGPTGFWRFRRLTLEKPSSHKEITSERESFQSMRSLPAQEVAESFGGLLNLPFLEDGTKRTRFWSLPKTRQWQPTDKRRYH